MYYLYLNPQFELLYLPAPQVLHLGRHRHMLKVGKQDNQLAFDSQLGEWVVP